MSEKPEAKMARASSVRGRAVESFGKRYERDGVHAMTREQWGEWVNALPMPEFMAMIDLCSPPMSKPRRNAKPRTGKYKSLCVQLLGVAAFHVEDTAAQHAIYKAVRALQRI